MSASLDPTGDLTYEINGPDYWGASYELRFAVDGVDFTAGGEVKHLFAWTHGCQRRGVNGDGTTPITLPPPLPTPYLWVYIPVVPHPYDSPAGVTLAEWDMYHLLGRLEPAHRGSLMLSMTRGWLAHNLADAQVHFGTFVGTPINNLDFGQWALHTVMEQYMEYIIMFKTVHPELYQPYLHGEGPPPPFYPQGLGADADPGLVLLGQKCFRKNRQTVDDSNRPASTGRYEPLQVQDWLTIYSMFVDQSAEIADMVFTSERFRVLHRALCGMGAPPLTDVDSATLILVNAENIFQKSGQALNAWAEETYQKFLVAAAAAGTAPAQMPDP
jgi:hypothetical protein